MNNPLKETTENQYFINLFFIDEYEDKGNKQSKIIYYLKLLIVIAAEGVAKIYDAAVKQCPNNEEFHSHLFMAYVRISDYKKQQQVRL